MLVATLIPPSRPVLCGGGNQAERTVQEELGLKPVGRDSVGEIVPEGINAVGSGPEPL